MRTILATLTIASLAFTAFTAEAGAAHVVKTFTLHQEPPAITTVDVGAPGKSNGDMLAFEAKLDGTGGMKATLYGLLVTVHVPDSKDGVEGRSGQIYLDFGNGNSIVVAGRSVYEGGATEMATAQPQRRAIIGGTGEYIGASGQVTTVHNKDGSYDHVIELVK